MHEDFEVNETHLAPVEQSTYEEKDSSKGKHYKKVDRNGSRKWKKIICTVTLATLLAAVGISAYNVHNNNVAKKNAPIIEESMSEIVEYHKDSTTLDELLASEVTEYETIEDLEKYLSLSRTLHDYDLGKYADGLNEVELGSDLFSLELTEELMKEFEILVKKDTEVLSNDSLRFYQVVTTLQACQNKIDEKIVKDGSSIIIRATDIFVKSVTLDASGLDSTKAGNMVLLSYGDKGNETFVVSYTDPVTNKVFRINIKEGSSIEKLIAAALHLDTTSTDITYVSSKINEIINMMKVITFQTYENDGTLHTDDDYLTVRESYKTYQMSK